LSFFQDLLRIMDAEMQRPTLFGWFHLLSLALTVALTVFLCLRYKNRSEKIRFMVLAVAVIVLLLEVYKQINYTFSYEDGITANYQWYAFPFQFCSTPMYIGLLAGLTKKGKIHEAACAYLATYAVFAGLCVMIYPGDVFIKTIGINIQTMICHGTMISVGVCLLATGYVKLEHKTILRAIPIFAACIAVAMIMNETAVATGIIGDETFNMFYISPHFEGTLPVYSLVQQVVPYPWCLVIYIAAFSVAAYLMLLIAMGVKKLTTLGKKKEAVMQ